MPGFEWPLIGGAEPLPRVFAAVTAVLGTVLAIVAVAAVLAWRRRRAGVAQTVRISVMAELQRDPALSGLSLTLSTRAPWTGETTVSLAGVVPSPWYRYAVIRAAARAVARTHRPVRIVDEIVIAERRPSPPATLRRA